MKVVKKRETTPSYICKNTEELGEHWHRNYITCTFTCKYFYVASNRKMLVILQNPIRYQSQNTVTCMKKNGLLWYFHFGWSFSDICWPLTPVYNFSSLPQGIS